MEQRVAGSLDALDIGGLVGRQRRLAKQPGQAEDAGQRRSEFMADGREETGLRNVGGFGSLACLDQRALDLLPSGDIAGDRDQLPDGALVVAHPYINPGEPARARQRLKSYIAGYDVTRFA